MKKILNLCFFLLAVNLLQAQQVPPPGLCGQPKHPEFPKTPTTPSANRSVKVVYAAQPADVAVTVESVHSVTATWKTSSFDSFSIGTSATAGTDPATRNIKYSQGLNTSDKTIYGYSYEELRQWAASPTNPAVPGGITFALGQSFYIHLYNGPTDYVCGPYQFNWTNLGAAGNVVTPVVETAFGLNGAGPFAVWQANNMKDFYDKVVPLIAQIYGPAAHNYTVGVVNDANSVGMNMFMNGPNWIYSSYNANGFGKMSQPRLMVHELIHGWRDNVCVSMNNLWHYEPTLSGFEEGMTEAAAQIVMDKFTTLYPSYFTAADLGYLNKRWGNQEGYAFDWDYDFQNHQQLTNANFMSSDIGIGAHWERYGTASAVFYKMYIEDNNFFKKFNAEYYTRLNVAQSNPNTYTRTDFVNILQTVLPKVEEEPMATWVAKQRILDCKVVPGKKVHMLTFNGQDGPRDMGHDNRINAIETQNNIYGDEWSWDVLNGAGALQQRWFHQLNNLSGQLIIKDYSGATTNTTNFRNNDMLYGGPHQGACITPNFNGPGVCFPTGIDGHSIYTTSADPAINNGGINDGQWYVGLGRPANGYVYKLQTDGLYTYNISFTDGGTFSDKYYRLHGNSFIAKDGMYAGVRNNADTPVTGKIYAEQKNKITPTLGEEPSVVIGVRGSLQASRKWASQPELTASLNGGRTDTRYAKPGKVHIIYVPTDCTQPQKIDFRNIAYGSTLSGVEMFLLNVDEFENIVYTETMPTTVCQNATATFTAANNWPYYLDDDSRITYQWQKNAVNIPGATSKIYTITNAQPTDAATYTLVINSFGCTITRTATMAVVPAIVLDPQVVTPQNVCLGGTINLNVTGTVTNPLPTGTTFAWTGPNSFTSTLQNPTKTNAILTDSGAYTVTCTVKACDGITDIIKTATINVNVNPINTPAISCGIATTSSVPFNWAAVNTATAYSVSYQVNSGPTQNIGNINNVLTYTVNSLAANDSVTMTLTPTGPAGTCFVPAVFTCQANPAPVCTPPTATVVSSTVIITCASPTVTLDGTGSTTGATISYKWTGPGVITNDTSLTPTVNAAGTYTLRVSNSAGGGCFKDATVTVTANTTAPNANAGTAQTLTCTIPTVTLGGTTTSTGTNFTHSWSNGTTTVGTTATLPNVTTAGTYTLTVSNTANGCTSTSSVLVTVDKTAPIANAGADKVITCAIQNVTLGDATTSTGANFTYDWSNGTTTVGTTATLPNVTTAGTYTLTVTNTANGCTSTSSVLVTVDKTAPIANAGADKVITCAIQNVTLGDATTSTGANFTYDWSNGTTTVGTTATLPNVTTAGTYTLTVSNTANGCTSTSSVLVTVDKTAPIANAGDDTVITCANPIISLGGASTLTGVSYIWKRATIIVGQTAILTNVTIPGIYVLTVKNNITGCTATDSVIVTQNINLPQVVVNHVSDNNYSLQITGGQAPYIYSISNGIIINNYNFTIKDSDYYTINVKDAKGCTTETTVYLKALDIEIPDYFTPNGDGNNDTWYPLRTQKYPNMEVLIFDRYQREIVRLKGNTIQGWDGNYNNNPLPSGDYWYVIKLNDEKNSKEILGGVTLVR
ncbi:T9SS type B sorting domain-containing protein [Flavobacterium psychrophilum]|nr:T9SS type B sorting domain-containing protein [Flavobacterium psychrophilum]